MEDDPLVDTMIGMGERYEAMRKHRLTVALAAARIEEIAADAERGEYESAHIMEDYLLIDCLVAIASGEVENPAELAKETLRVRELKYARWYA